MAKTRRGINNVARQNIFNNQRFAAAKEIGNARRRNRHIKIKFFIPQLKRGQVKRPGHAVREMTVRRHAIYPAKRWNGE